MIQLYKSNNENYEKNGDFTLTPSSFLISAELNGSWSFSMSHPIDLEDRWKYIKEEAVVKSPSFNGDQLFRIKNVTKTDIEITAIGYPIFMDSTNDCFLIDSRPTQKTGQEAIDIMTSLNNKYSGSSNILKRATAYYQFKNLMEALNGSDDNSFINRWGGEILFDNFMVIINDRIGEDNEVELRYGKNVSENGFSEEVDIRDVITRIYPKAYNGYTMTNNGYVDSPLINSYPTIKIATITFDDVKMREDASEDDEANGVIICDTQEELDTALKGKCESQYDSGLDKPKVTIKADMVLLQNTEQYKDYAILESVGLGDTIHCINNHLGIETSARVIELVYDSVLKKTDSVVIGEAEYNYFNNVTSSVNRIDSAIRPDGSVVAEQIKGFIDGVWSQLRLQNTVAKKQDVRAILFEDLDPDSETFGALSIGTQGLQISRQRTAANDDWIWTTALTAGGLIANIIVAGLISDKDGKSYWNLDTGELNLAGIFKQFTGNGQPSIEIQDNVIKVFGYGSGTLAGYLNGFQATDGTATLGLWAAAGKNIVIGYESGGARRAIMTINSSSQQATFGGNMNINGNLTFKGRMFTEDPETGATVRGLSADIILGNGVRGVFNEGLLVRTYNG